MSALILALGIGFVAGLRTFTAPAAVSWAACYGWIDLQGTPLQFMGSWAAAAVFSFLALAEYVADKLPRTPGRTRPGPLTGRILFGGLSGVALALSLQSSTAAGAVPGAIGAVIGAFTGYNVRTRLVPRLGVKDIMVAIPEDLVAIGLAYLIVTASKYPGV
jgi:uncharacterized membrane protein